ncbi:hypothetical protein ASPSYDRAFT_86346 [Aspergillus sydowii CBS 593.65]|uniref:Uncharacterized protein n=1 Tax=Aspergillus sydowii CBS 593.65 TaxID=1036612 RepID=A0A1L9TTB8_9EURO|nr:uncharacterized protein ASPSYDRAFT_86346 [Aspergillus sydowii CBS 593.65]OJJ62679.1 hypothetical protein ASPSYDRAFT_86346 [Aspergillus sydowii CBS 593.65]
MAQTLREFFSNEGYYEILHAILSHSTASATAALLAALGQFSPTIDVTENDYLHPLRDVDHTMQLVRPWIQDGYQILMIGPDSRRLLYRIKSPEKYYTEYTPDMKLEMWVVAIPHGIPDCVKNVGRLQRIWRTKRWPLNIRARAMMELEQIIDKSIISQYADKLFNEMDEERQIVSGDNIQVKWFDLKDNYSMSSDRHTIRLEFRGLKCCLPWNLSDSDPGRSHWRPEDGIPYINAANPFDLQKAEKNVSRGWTRDDCNMAFCSKAPEYRPQSPVALPINL